MTYGYEGDILLLTRITPPEDLPADQPVILKAVVRWLTCKVECVPGQAELSLTMPVTDSAPVINQRLRGIFREAQEDLPRTSDQWTFRVTRGREFLHIDITPLSADSVELRDLRFFHTDPMLSTILCHPGAQ